MNYNKLKFRTLYLPFLLTLTACRVGSDTDWQQAPNDVRYQITQTNKQGVTVKPDDFCAINLKYYTATDSLLFNSRLLPNDLVFQYTPQTDPSGFRTCLGLLKTGEKGVFYIDAFRFFSQEKKQKMPEIILKGEQLKLEIELKAIIDPKIIEAEQEKQIRQLKATEKLLIEDYLAQHFPHIKYDNQKLIVLSHPQVGPKKATKKNEVSIHYNLWLLNGKKIDSSIDRAELFEFETNDSNIIEGLKLAVEDMQIGNKKTVIITSELAYGAQGIEKFIPPFSPLLFEIELINWK